MKRWVQNLINQFNFDSEPESPLSTEALSISEDRATLLFIIDTYNKHLLEIDRHPVRKVREALDDFAKELLNPDRKNIDKLLFRFRQFFGGYRIDEYTYILKTFEEFRGIIWDFVDQLSEDLSQEQTADKEIMSSLSDLKEAVEANSIDLVKEQSRKFIDFYVERQTRRDTRRSQRILSIKKNLDSVRKQLFEANQSMRQDHLTGAYNRKSFDEQINQHVRIMGISPNPVTLLTLDIDHFKRVNDTFGHAIGDFVIKECVNVLHSVFQRPTDFVARIGGEEFAVILPGFTAEKAEVKAQELLDVVRKDVFIHEGHELRFTVSVGVAQLEPGEDKDNWIKRADEALYSSKHNGRNRSTVAPTSTKSNKAA